MLEEHGVHVHPPEEKVFLGMTASGRLDVIKAVVDELHCKYPRSGPVAIDGKTEGTDTRPGAAPSDRIAGEARAAIHAEAMLPETGLAAQEDSPRSAERAADAKAQSAGRRPATGALEAQERADPHQPLYREVVIVPGEARYHSSGCLLIRLLSSDNLETSTRQKAEADGCVPCRGCKPDEPLSAQT
jgi:hypothetical protein